MSKGWMRVREAAALLSVSESTVRRRVAEGLLRGRTGVSGRQEVFLPAKLRDQGQATVLSPAPSNTGSDGDTPGALERTDTARPSAWLSDESPEEVVSRYQKLAGGSLVLAQKRADELTQAASAAYENLAHTRDQLRQVRKVAVVGWSIGALTVLLAFCLCLAFGISSARSDARARASQREADHAIQRIDQLHEKLVESTRAQGDGFGTHAAVETE